MAAVYGKFRMCQSYPLNLSNFDLKMMSFVETSQNNFKIKKNSLHDLGVFTPGLVSLKWAKSNILFWFLSYFHNEIKLGQ